MAIQRPNLMQGNLLIQTPCASAIPQLAWWNSIDLDDPATTQGIAIGLTLGRFTRQYPRLGKAIHFYIPAGNSTYEHTTSLVAKLPTRIKTRHLAV